jgi:uncharacterized membrane protein
MKGKTMSTVSLMTLTCAVGCGLVAGFFFSFSVVVMGALGKIAPAHGIEAMQSINVVVLNPLFFTAFFGTAAVCVWAIITALTRWHAPRALLWLAGGAIYLLGVIVVTMRFNVPQNNALAALPAASPEAAKLWAHYLSSWTAWNHVRTIAPLVSAVLFTVAALQSPIQND